MMNVYLWLMVAIIIAAAVFVVAGMIAADETDAREDSAPTDRSPRAVLGRLVTDARAGARSLSTWRRDRGPRRDPLDLESESSTTVEEFFEATSTEGRAYLDADEIQQIIQRVRPSLERR